MRSSRFTQYLGLAAVLVVLVTLFGLSSDHFFSRVTFTTLANQIPALTVIAVGMTLVLIAAGIDLSVGSVMALSSSLLALARVTWQLPAAGGRRAVSGGRSCRRPGERVHHGPLVGSIVHRHARDAGNRARRRLPRHRIAVGVRRRSHRAHRRAAAGHRLSPAFLVAALVVAAGQILLSRTVLGRYIFAIGANPEAARLSGIDPRRVLVAVFAMSGLLAGLGGVFHLAYLESADPNSGIGLELSAIAAVVIGGTSLMGGRGSVVSSFFGVLIIAVLQSRPRAGRRDRARQAYRHGRRHRRRRHPGCISSSLAAERRVNDAEEA